MKAIRALTSGLAAICLAVTINACAPIKPVQHADFQNTEVQFKNKTDPKTVRLNYVLRGERNHINFEVYRGLRDSLSNLTRLNNYLVLGSMDYFELRNINETTQRQFIRPLVSVIQSLTENKDDQARIAISLVQNIPYDTEAFNSGTIRGRYAYEVLYDKKSVCGEKSQLTALLLKELGFGTALFNFEPENHEALGVRCPPEYDYRNSGYCFVETTRPNILTFIPTDYIKVGELKSTPEILQVNAGLALGDISKEQQDAAYLRAIQRIIKDSHGTLGTNTRAYFKL